MIALEGGRSRLNQVAAGALGVESDHWPRISPCLRLTVGLPYRTCEDGAARLVSVLRFGKEPDNAEIRERSGGSDVAARLCADFRGVKGVRSLGPHTPFPRGGNW